MKITLIATEYVGLVSETCVAGIEYRSIGRLAN